MVHKFPLKLLQQLMWPLYGVWFALSCWKDHTLQNASSLSSCELLHHVTWGVSIDCCTQINIISVGDLCIPEYKCCKFLGVWHTEFFGWWRSWVLFCIPACFVWGMRKCILSLSLCKWMIHQTNISGPTDNLVAGPVGCGLRVGRGSAYKFVTSFAENLEPSPKKLRARAHTHARTHTHTKSFLALNWTLVDQSICHHQLKFCLP